MGTGEEGELVTFCCRSKLFIWKDEQWKERGLGDVKILQDQNSFKSRIVMRREQVKKVCLNLRLVQENKESLKFKNDSENKALTFAGMDFSDMENDNISEQKGEVHTFCLRF